MDFRRDSVETLADMVQSREVSAREMTGAALARIEELNPTIGAFVAVDEEAALAQAADIDQRIARGEDVGPLAGVPLAVKDTEDAIGYRTTHGSRLIAESPVAERNSILVERLRQAGCVVVGKTNTPELAWKGDTDNLVFGRTGNPWSTERSAGGSSGGSSAAVAAGMVGVHHDGPDTVLAELAVLFDSTAGRSRPPGGEGDYPQ